SGESGAVTIDAAAGAAPAGADAAAAGTRSARQTRRAQLEKILKDSAQTRQCMEPLDKRDLVAGSYVTFDIRINADGSQGHLNVADSNVPPEVEACLRRLVDAAELPPGPAAELSYKLAF